MFFYLLVGICPLEFMNFSMLWLNICSYRSVRLSFPQAFAFLVTAQAVYVLCCRSLDEKVQGNGLLCTVGRSVVLWSLIALPLLNRMLARLAVKSRLQALDLLLLGLLPSLQWGRGGLLFISAFQKHPVLLHFLCGSWAPEFSPWRWSLPSAHSTAPSLILLLFIHSQPV